MGRKVGLGYHYPPLERVIKTYMVLVPVVFIASQLFELPASILGGWLALIVGLFAMGWLLQALQMVMGWFQRM